MKEKNDFIPLKPFKKWVLENFPFIEEDFDAITSYQLWCKIVEYVKVIGANEEKLIKAFNELKDYVDNYFNNLDVQDEIDNKLDEMALDGTLERIINEEIFTDLYNTINEVKGTVDTIEPIVYDNEKNIKFPTYSLGIERTMRFIRSDQYKSFQAFCFSTTNKILTTLWTGTDNRSILLEINSNTGIGIRSTQLDYGWTNGITYDSVNNLIYIIPRGQSDNTYLKTIKVLNYTDLSEINTVLFEDYIQSIYYDDENDEIYLLSEYGLRETNGFKVYKVDSRFNILETININITGELNNLNIQNFAIHNNYIYFISSDPKLLLVYNIDGTLFKIYNLNDYINDLYYSGEYQDIDFLDNECYISSADNIENSESINQFFKISLNKENIDRKKINTNVHEGRAITLYVNSNSTSANPDGSIDNKFKSINEAIRCKGTTNIKVVGGTYNGIDIRSKSFISITNTDTTDPDYNEDPIIVKGIEVNYSNNIYLEDITINQDLFGNNGYITLYKSDVTLKDIIISGNKYGIYVGYGCKCKLSSGIDLTGITSDNQIYVRSESVLFTPSTYYKIEKHNESATVVGGIRLFETDREMVVGEFTFDNNMNYIFNNSNSLSDYFKEIAVIYTIGTNKYQQRFQLLSSRNPMQLAFDNMDGSGNIKHSRAYVDINEGKFRIRFSRVGTTTNSGTTSVITNSDNTNYDADSIIVNNCILY